MMTIRDGNTIVIPRGDTGAVTVNLQGDIPDGSTACITVRYSTAVPPVFSREYVIRNDSFNFTMSSKDSNIAPGDYLWDLRIKRGDNIDTPINAAPFIIEKVMSDVC